MNKYEHDRVKLFVEYMEKVDINDERKRSPYAIIGCLQSFLWYQYPEIEKAVEDWIERIHKHNLDSFDEKNN